ncbi:MAG: hypothetical protein K6347_07405 [Campylobacterales bacterium]
MFKKVYVGIVINRDKIDIATIFVKRGRILERQRKSFLTPDGSLSQEVISFLLDLQERYTYTYTATLLDTVNQGALPSCSRTLYEELGIKMSTIARLCLSEGWSIYVGLEELKKAQEKFAPVEGIDYLFSPAVLIFNHYAKELVEKPTLYLFMRSALATLAIFSESKLLYCSNYPLSYAFEEEQKGEDEATESLFDIDLIDELGGIKIEDLDVDLDKDVIIREMEPTIPGSIISQTGDERTLEILLKIEDFLKRSLEEYYTNEVYQGDFVERIILIDEVGIAEMLKKYIEEELFITTQIDSFDLAEALAELARVESE